MGWIEGKSVWIDCPHFADVFEGREALEGLQPPPIIVGVDEVVEMRSQLGMAVMVVPFDGGRRAVCVARGKVQLGHRLWVDPVTLGQNDQALLTMLFARRTAAVVRALSYGCSRAESVP